MSDKDKKSTDEVQITDEMVVELKRLILIEEEKVIHLRKHGMTNKIIELIKARIK